MQALLNKFMAEADSSVVEMFNELHAEVLSYPNFSERTRLDMYMLIAGWINEELNDSNVSVSITHMTVEDELRNIMMEIKWEDADNILAIIEAERV